MSKEQELKEMLKLYSKQDLWNKIQEKQAMIYDLEVKLADYNEIMNDYNIQNIAELDEFLAKYDFDEDKDGNTISQVIVSDQKYIDIGYFNTIYNENQQLKQQLAEKDDELLQKEKKIQDLMLYEFVATTLDFNKLSADNCKLREQLAKHNQDKISFCIENLEKVKEHISSGLAFDIDVQMWFEEYIDNQIESLKKGVE